MIGCYVGIYDPTRLMDPTVNWTSKEDYDRCVAGADIYTWSTRTPVYSSYHTILRVIEHPVGFGNRDDVKFLVWHE